MMICFISSDQIILDYKNRRKLNPSTEMITSKNPKCWCLNVKNPFICEYSCEGSFSRYILCECERATQENDKHSECDGKMSLVSASSGRAGLFSLSDFPPKCINETVLLRNVAFICKNESSNHPSKNEFSCFEILNEPATMTPGINMSSLTEETENFNDTALGKGETNLTWPSTNTNESFPEPIQINKNEDNKINKLVMNPTKNVSVRLKDMKKRSVQVLNDYMADERSKINITFPEEKNLTQTITAIVPTRSSPGSYNPLCSELPSSSKSVKKTFERATTITILCISLFCCIFLILYLIFRQMRRRISSSRSGLNPEPGRSS